MKHHGHSRRRMLQSTLCGGLVAVPALRGFAGDQSHTSFATKAKATANHTDRPLTVLIPLGSGANMLPVAEAFKTRSGVSIDFVEVPVEQINTSILLNSLTGTNEFDLALAATYGIPDLVAANAILPLTEYARQHEPSGFLDDALYVEGDSFNNDFYGYQTDGDAYVMFYNDRFLSNQKLAAEYEDRFGETLDLPATWDQLDRQMAFFHRPDDGMYGGLLFRTPGYVAWEWWVRMHAKGVWPLSADLTPQIASDEGVEVLEEMIRASEHLVPLSSVDTGLFENWARYEKGDVYCNIGWGGTQKFLNQRGSRMRGNMRFGPTPGGLIEGQQLITPYFNWGWTYVVSASTDVAELAYLFSCFAVSPEISTIAVQEKDGFFDPFRTEHYDDPIIREIYSPEFLKVHEASMRGAIPDFYLAQRGAYFASLSEWLMRGLMGEVPAKDAMRRASEEWKLISIESGIDRQMDRWQQLRKKYPPDVAKMLRDLPKH